MSASDNPTPADTANHANYTSIDTSWHKRHIKSQKKSSALGKSILLNLLNITKTFLICFRLYFHRLPHVKHIYYEGKNNDILRSYPFITSYRDLIHFGHHISDEELQKARDATQPEHIAQIAFSTVNKIPKT